MDPEEERDEKYQREGPLDFLTALKDLPKQFGSVSNYLSNTLGGLFALKSITDSEQVSGGLPQTLVSRVIISHGKNYLKLKQSRQIFDLVDEFSKQYGLFTVPVGAYNFTVKDPFSLTSRLGKYNTAKLGFLFFLK